MLRLIKKGDELLLLSDGVTAAVAQGRFLEILQSAPISLYALQDDIEARGLAGQIAVRLSVKHAGQLSW
jgi:tRNA 2-thiouridine synthesizing protein B